MNHNYDYNRAIMTASKQADHQTQSILKSFGSEVKAMRMSKNITRSSLAEMSGLCQDTLYKVEIGLFPNISLYTLVSLCIALDYYDWKFFSITKF